MNKILKIAMGLAILAPMPAFSAIQLIATGTITTPGNHDLSGLGYNLENGLQADFFGGVGSGLAYAGGNTFLGLPDRGPNATPYAGGATIDNTASWISRFHTMQLVLTPSAGPLPFELTTQLDKTTLMWSADPLIYGNGTAYNGGAGLAGDWINKVAGTPAGTNYFSGRSDNYVQGSGLGSLNPDFARLDPEAIRVSADGKSIFMSDEYGPYVRQFDRATGELIKTFDLPAHLAIQNLFPTVADERNPANNPVGRYTNSGMEGLAITPDGKYLVGAIQGALEQDRINPGGNVNVLRLIKIEIATGDVTEYAYLANAGTMIGVSEIIAINNHEFLIDERDGSGIGGSPATANMKHVYKIDLAGATPIPDGVKGADAAKLAVPKTLFLDLVAALNANGILPNQIPSKIEGMAFGQDVMLNGALTHTLYISDDNDFVPATSGPNHFYVFGFTDADLPGYQAQQIANVPEPATWAMMIGGFALAGASMRRRKAAVRFA